MARLVIFLAMMVIFWSEPVRGAHQVEFSGTIGEITYSGDPVCHEVFSETSYTTKHFLVGPTRRTLVTYFTDNDAGFFSNQTFMGNYGYNSNFIDQKYIEHQSIRYLVDVYGIVTTSFAMIDVTVSVEDDTQEIYCEAFGRYFASIN